MPVLLLAGACASVSGTNIRTIIINVTIPEFRGTAIGLLNVLGCIGRGVGPSLTGLYIIYSKTSRVEAIRACLWMWVFSGAILCVGGLTLARDEEKVKVGNKKEELSSSVLTAGTNHDSGSGASGGSSKEEL